MRTRRSVLGWCLCVISMAECAALAGDVERVRDQLSTDLTYRPDY